jgi:outer membrane protein OmpA-like peptidoglycan-associated protein
MKHITFIILAICWLLPASVFAAKNTFSKRYNNKTVKEVLADLKETTGTRVSYNRKEISNARRVTLTFHNASPEEVLNELFDCEYTITKKGKKGNSFTVTKRILQQSDSAYTSVPVDTVSLDSRVTSQVEQAEQNQTLLYREERLLVNYRDSILHTQERIERPQVTKQVSVKDIPADQGSSLQFYLGAAYSSMGYTLRDGQNFGHAGGEASIRYAYFFTPEWGLGLGVDFTTYGSRAKLNTTLQWGGQTDSDGEQYNHRAVTHDWQENQRIYILSIPLTIQYQHRFNDKVGIFAALGGFAGLPLISNYALVSGMVEHRGQYPQWNLELYNLANHDFYTEHIGEDFTKEQQKLSLKTIAAGVKLDLGVLVPLTGQLDLFAGVYGSVVCNNLQSEQHELGWQQSGRNDYRQHAFMPEYQGLANSTYANAIRPWAAGIKIGIHFRPAKKAPKPLTGEGCFVRIDTTYLVAQHADTIVRASVDTIVSLKKTLETSIIWFNVNDYKHPRLEPADILEKVAEILKSNPAQRVYINGHASEEGSQRNNQILSNRRAETIANMLQALGVPAQQLVVHGYSADVEYHGANTTSRTQRELNRRVEIIPIND